MRHRRAKKKEVNKRLWGVVFILSFLFIVTFFYYYPIKEGIKKEKEVLSQRLITSKGDVKRVKLFFSSIDGETLITESRQIIDESYGVERAKKAIIELIKGPFEKGMQTIPKETKLRELYIDNNGLAYVDFSKEITQNYPKGVWTEVLGVYSIVNTLVFNFSEIKQVKILIEGKEAETLAGHIDIEEPFKDNISIVNFN
ncbi:MAG TPA: GerMN domain-containing protein [Nitrospinota bacterium]|nr:GerMN domain-containing protein [Nitrospinota bacterium]